jgi:hypothetical protein
MVPSEKLQEYTAGCLKQPFDALLETGLFMGFPPHMGNKKARR